jgi:hypothetical protein
MSVAFIDEIRQMIVISLGLRVVNLRSGGRQRYKGAMLSEPELWGMLAADGWSRGSAACSLRRFAGRGSSLLVSQVLLLL